MNIQKVKNAKETVRGSWVRASSTATRPADKGPRTYPRNQNETGRRLRHHSSNWIREALASGSNWTDDFEREGNCWNFEYVAVPRNHSRSSNTGLLAPGQPFFFSPEGPIVRELSEFTK